MLTFAAQHITQSQIISLPATPDQVFPLFEPLGEKHWATGWNPHMLYPTSGIAEEGMVFTTQHADEPTKIWTIVAYERAGLCSIFQRLTTISYQQDRRSL